MKDVIAKGVSSGTFAYVGKSQDGEYDPVYYKQTLSPGEIEITDDMFLVKDPKSKTEPKVSISVTPAQVRVQPGEEITFSAQCLDKEGQKMAAEGLMWSLLAAQSSLRDSSGLASKMELLLSQPHPGRYKAQLQWM